MDSVEHLSKLGSLEEASSSKPPEDNAVQLTFWSQPYRGLNEAVLKTADPRNLWDHKYMLFWAAKLVETFAQ